MRLSLQKTDGRHLASCKARKFLFVLWVMALLPVQAGQNIDTSESPEINLTAAERQWLKADPSIVLGYNSDTERIIIQGEDGSLSGKQVEKHLDFDIKSVSSFVHHQHDTGATIRSDWSKLVSILQESTGSSA